MARAAFEPARSGANLLRAETIPRRIIKLERAQSMLDASGLFASVEQLFYTSRMSRIGIRELNQQTSLVLERVRRGEVFTITDHGEPVARLVPVGDTRSVMDSLIAAGKAIPRRRRGPLPRPIAFGPPEVDSTDVVRAMRDEE